VTVDSPISGQKVVARVENGLIYASNDSLQTINGPLALTLNAAVAGDEVEIIRSGEVTDSSWSWTEDGLIYLGTDGNITQTAPGSGRFQVVLGRALTPTSIVFNPSAPIKLA
jgi:hypothetical protein